MQRNHLTAWRVPEGFPAEVTHRVNQDQKEGPSSSKQVHMPRPGIQVLRCIWKTKSFPQWLEHRVQIHYTPE